MIRLDDVSFAYETGQGKVLDGVTLDIAAGTHVALLGRNGSGKSTLARLLNGLLRPTSGRVTVDGLDPANPHDVVAVRRRLQMVFQNPENQQVGTTVFEDIAFGLANIGFPTERMRDRAVEALALVGLDVSLDREVASLSGGELQRLALASSLALEPDTLVLDEVTSMLDPEAAARLTATMVELRRQTPRTIVQITHHLDEIDAVDRVVLLRDGRVVADGSPAEVLAHSHLLAECGLRPPYEWQRPDDPAPRRRGADPAPRRRGAASEIGNAAVATRDLVVGYGARRRFARRRSAPVLTGATLTIQPGELVAVAGRSGAGKSTLIAAIKGLLRPESGAVTVGGTDPWRTRSPELFDRVGYVFQRPEHQLFAPTVRADVAYGLSASGLAEDALRERVDEALAQLGLEPGVVGDLSPFELSGGQQRRVALAGVIVTRPEVLILDEPTAGLDHPSREALFEILDALRAQGTAIVWVSHRFDEVLENADRLLVVADGTVIADAVPERLLADATLRQRMGWPLLPELDPARRRGAALEAITEATV